jgi:hypothetical protein
MSAASASQAPDIRTEDVTFYSGPALRMAGRVFHPPGADDGEKKLHLFSTGNHYSVYDELLEDTFKVAHEWLDAQSRA